MSHSARRALGRLGYLTGVWRHRLAGAGPELSGFINRFHGATGVGRVIEAYFAGRYQRATAKMAMCLSTRMVASDTDYARTLHFDRRVTFAPDGEPLTGLVVGYKGRHYYLFPWRRLHVAALQKQLRRAMLMHDRPERVRWVFCGRKLKERQELRASLRRLLSGSSPPATRPWVDSLSRTALIL